jgi:SAM-dependent methyltransferase
VEPHFEIESQRLARSWQRYQRQTLRDYLVQGVEDPRINVQSILTRHFLIEQLFPSRFTELMDAEMRFAVVINWLHKLVASSTRSQDLGVVLDAILDRCEHAGDIKIPRYVLDTFQMLPCQIEGIEIPNYIADTLTWSPVETVDIPIADRILTTFQSIWNNVLAEHNAETVSVLEPACGSANDYRFIHSYGIARFLDYHGFDICEKNIQNARHMFEPDRFQTANALDINHPDKSFDYCFVHDLFEHLSIEAMEKTITEICRVTKNRLCLGFFNIHTGPKHRVLPIDNYHWNQLSLSALTSTLKTHCREIQIIPIDEYLISKCACPDTHNKNAHTIIAEIS